MGDLSPMEEEHRAELTADFKLNEMIFKNIRPSFSPDYIQAMKMLTKIKKEKRVLTTFDYMRCFSHLVNKLNNKSDK